MLKKIKYWVWVVVVGAIGLLMWTRKPKWVREKEKEIKQRDKEISRAKEKADSLKINYEELKQKNDQSIEQASKSQDTKPFDDPDDAADFIDNILSSCKGK